MAEIARTVPNNFEAEQAVLCCILIDALNAPHIVANLSQNSFYTTAHKMIFAAMEELNRKLKPLDYVAVCSKLTKNGNIDKVGGIVYISDLTNLLPSAANCDYYADIIKREALMRSLINMCNSVTERCYSDVTSSQALAFAQSLLLDIYKQDGNDSLVHIDKGVDLVMERFNDLLAGKPIRGCKSGFYNLDRVINCYQPGQMIVLAARPGCGKTSFAMNIVSNIALSNKEKVIAVFNLEMGVVELAQRFMLSIAEVPYKNIAERKSVSSINSLWNVKKQLLDTNVYIDESSDTSAEGIFGKLKELKLRKGRLDFVVIDYLQLMKHSGTNKNDSYQNQVANTSRALKLMAKELDVPIMVLSQTSRGLEKRDDKTPMMSDLRDSGAIEQDADQIYFLTKSEQGEADEFQKIELHIVKNRSGEAGKKLTFKWEGDIVKFTPAEEGKFVSGKKNNDAKATEGDAAADSDTANGAAQEELPAGVYADNADNDIDLYDGAAQFRDLSDIDQ